MSSFHIGNTFVNNPTSTVTSHLWIVISNPFDNPEQIAIVNLTSWRDKAVQLNDTSCIVEVGDHEFVRKKSYISYRDARIVFVKEMQGLMHNGLICFRVDCSDEFFDKILDGAENSRFLPLEVRKVLLVLE